MTSKATAGNIVRNGLRGSSRRYWPDSQFTSSWLADRRAERHGFGRESGGVFLPGHERGEKAGDGGADSGGGVRSGLSALQGRVNWGGALSGRDIEAVNKTVSGLIKLLYPAPDMNIPDAELEIIVRLALESRRRVKEQQSNRPAEPSYREEGG